MFEEGGVYRNRRGEYEVLRIDGDRMTIRYEDGGTAEVDVATQAQILANMQREEERRLPSSNEGVNQAFFGTVGYLARHAMLIEGFGPPQATRGFARVYRALTGRSLSDEAHYYPHDQATDKWGVELRIEYPTPSSGHRLEFAGFSARSVASPKGAGIRRIRRINSNGYIRYLFGLGFTFGTGQDVERIRAAVPEAYKGAFDAGAGW